MLSLLIGILVAAIAYLVVAAITGSGTLALVAALIVLIAVAVNATGYVR